LKKNLGVGKTKQNLNSGISCRLETKYIGYKIHNYWLQNTCMITKYKGYSKIELTIVLTIVAVQFKKQR
jgi:hypothetical protein